LPGTVGLVVGVQRDDDRSVLTRALFNSDGSVRTRRMIITSAILVALALFGTIMVVATPAWNGHSSIQTAWVIFSVFLLKFPLVGFLWWLIVRNKEIPGVPVVWSEREVGEILDYLREQAKRAIELPDASVRLEYLSKEAWHVADCVDGPGKGDAVSVALSIDELSARSRGRRLA
jgi:hypothetical protein